MTGVQTCALPICFPVTIMAAAREAVLNELCKTTHQGIQSKRPQHNRVYHDLGNIPRKNTQSNSNVRKYRIPHRRDATAMWQMSRVQTQTAARLGDANVDGVKNTDAGMVFDTDVESRVCARNGKRNRRNPKRCSALVDDRRRTGSGANSPTRGHGTF